MASIIDPLEEALSYFDAHSDIGPLLRTWQDSAQIAEAFPDPNEVGLLDKVSQEAIMAIASLTDVKGEPIIGQEILQMLRDTRAEQLARIQRP